MTQEQGHLDEAAALAAAAGMHDVIRWRATWRVDKYHGDWTPAQIAAGLAPAPYETIVREGNLLMYGGVSCLWQCLIGNGTGTAGQTLTFFNNANATIGVGDSTTAAAATQTDLQAATNKLRKAQDATYPQHTDATTSGAASIVFKSTFGSADANFAWQEWAIFNGAAGGRMLNRKVESLGTKASGTTWALTVTLTLA
ncbi:MAG: hypothetical protein IPK75_17785 [Acidobacteria bacterium]|nr:hypothetical protein [Acidobacteriota bacterium]